MDNEIYREFIIELFQNPHNFGKMDDPDKSAEVHNPTCGDRITLYLKIKNDVISDVSFSGQGCAISQASASLLTDAIKGRSLDEVQKLQKEDVLNLIRLDLSRNPTRMRCALLVLDALKKALREE
jgi:nitrogen fixation NifU-like protein